MKKILDLNDAETVQVDQATSWSFYFEGERYFEGTRSFLTAGGIEKPLLNAYRMLAHLGSRRIEATSTAAWPVVRLDARRRRQHAGGGRRPRLPDEDGTVAVLVWRHTDDQYQTARTRPRSSWPCRRAAGGRLPFCGTAGSTRDHSNAHTVWQDLGSPQDPTDEQLAAIRPARVSRSSSRPRDVTVDGRRAAPRPLSCRCPRSRCWSWSPD